MKRYNFRDDPANPWGDNYDQYCMDFGDGECGHSVGLIANCYNTFPKAVCDELIANELNGCTNCGTKDPSAPADTLPPGAVFISPIFGSPVKGAVMLEVNVSDNSGKVGGVQFSVDGSPLGVEVTVPAFGTTFRKSWDSTTVSDGIHQVGAVARDAAGNTTTSTAVNVTVNNVVPGSQNYTAAGSYNFTVPTYNTLTVTVWLKLV